MNIILVTRQFPYGGNETFLETEIKYLSKNFNSVVVYPSTKGNTIRDLPENVKVNTLIADQYSKKTKWILKTVFSSNLYLTIFRYYKIIRTGKSLFHLLKHCISYNIYLYCLKNGLAKDQDTLVYSYWFSAFVEAATKTLKTPCLVTRAHRGDLYENVSKLGFFPNRENVIKNVRMIFSISDNGATYLREKYKAKNVFISKLGVDNHLYAVSNSSTSINSLCLVSVSNIIPLKKVDFIAKCLVRYAQINPNDNIKWTHFGNGEEMGKIKQIVTDYDGDNFFFEFPGRIANTSIYEYYAANPVDIFINLSISEGIPVSMMEAISYGIPIIATNVGGVNEIVNDSTGVLLSSRPTETQVLKAIDTLRTIPKDREVIKQFWFENFNSDTNYSHFCDTLKQLNN